MIFIGTVAQGFIMIKYSLSLLLFFAPSFLFPMEKDRYADIKPSTAEPLHRKIADLHGIKTEKISHYYNLPINPSEIKSIEKCPCPLPDTENYYATLANEDTVSCTHFSSGEYAGEIWAVRSFHSQMREGIIPQLSIGQSNFFILKSYYEKQTKK
jgi:hypothetical protein